VCVCACQRLHRASLKTPDVVQKGHPDEVDLLRRHGISVDVYYIDSSKKPWKLPHAQVFTGSPADFEFKLSSIATPLETLEAMAADIHEHADVALPVVHGAFGEGGELLRVLESAGVNYVGSGAAASGAAFNKVTSRKALMAAGFPTLQQFSLSSDDFKEPVKAATLTVRCPHDLLCTWQLALVQQRQDEIGAMIWACCPGKRGLICAVAGCVSSGWHVCRKGASSG
jgi:hypothetical protein